MPKYHIGSLDDASKSALVETEVETDPSAEPRATFLRPKIWAKSILVGKKIVSWDTRIFTFKLDHPEQTLGLPIGKHLMVRLRDPETREAIIRSYTPISNVKDKGTMKMLVKVYFDTSRGKGGKMSQAIDALPIGNSIEMKGPIGKFEYCGHGKCLINEKPRHVKTFVMICGGSGITPIYQVFRAVMQNPNDETKCIVLDGNRLFEDILCREELEELSSATATDAKCYIL